MKLLIAIIFSFPCLAHAQNLNFSDLISISLKSSEYLEEVMFEKKWELFDAESDGMYDVFTYSYNKLLGLEQAESFLRVSIVNGEWPLSFRERNRKLVLQFTNSQLMRNMVADVNRLGYKLEKSLVINGENQKHYLSKSKKTHVVLITSGSQKSGSNITTNYYVAIYAPVNYGWAYDKN